MLSDAGVHIIDMGFPSAAPSERRALELILEGKKKGRIRPDLEIIVMCRSNARDIDITVDTLEQMGMRAARLHVLHLHLRLRPAPQVQDRQDAAAARGPQARGVAGPARLLLPRGQHPHGHARPSPTRAARGGGDRVRRRGRLARRRRLPDRAGPRLLRGRGHALLVPGHRRLLRARGRRLLHPEAGGGLPGQAARHPLPQRLRPRRLQHRARAAPRRHHPHLHRQRHRRARGQRARCTPR